MGTVSEHTHPVMHKFGLVSISRQWPGLWLVCKVEPFTEMDGLHHAVSCRVGRF